jgi:cyanophycin synthetase
MFAAALAFSLDKSLEDIRHGLRTFSTTFFQAPGRMNVYDEYSFRVILDYAHNSDGVGHMSDLATKLDVKGKRVVVIAGPGDRRDVDLENIAKAAAGKFDYYICKADDNRRGRGETEVADIIANTLKAEGISDDQIKVIPDEVSAIDHALNIAVKDDLLIIFADAITRSWKQIISFDSDIEDSSTHSSSHNISESNFDTFVLEEGMTIVEDERGVRIVEHLAEESD